MHIVYAYILVCVYIAKKSFRVQLTSHDIGLSISRTATSIPLVKLSVAQTHHPANIIQFHAVNC